MWDKRFTDVIRLEHDRTANDAAAKFSVRVAQESLEEAEKQKKACDENTAKKLVDIKAEVERLEARVQELEQKKEEKIMEQR